jgi:hypothetical protein
MSGVSSCLASATVMPQLAESSALMIQSGTFWGLVKGTMVAFFISSGLQKDTIRLAFV